MLILHCTPVKICASATRTWVTVAQSVAFATIRLVAKICSRWTDRPVRGQLECILLKQVGKPPSLL
jgi:hypothetical protein